MFKYFNLVRSMEEPRDTGKHLNLLSITKLALNLQ